MGDWDYYSKIIHRGDTVEIPFGESESGPINCTGLTLIGINIPSEFEGTSIFFKSSEAEEGPYGFLTDLNGQLIGAHAIGSDSRVRIGDLLETEEWIKVCSTSTQTAARTLTLIFKRF